MKQIQLSIMIMLVPCLMLFASCEGEQGEVGPAGQDGDEGIAGTDGEEGSAGADGEDGAKGETGNANATLYKFDGHDFSESDYTARLVESANEQELSESAWLVYFMFENIYR